MRHLVEAVRAAVSATNWHAALTQSLTLPDIAGRIEYGAVGSKDRYTRWADRYLAPLHTLQVGSERESHVFLCGADLYALRCAFLHEGEFDITDQRARKALASFTFASPAKGISLHLVQHNDRLLLMVDKFCDEMCQAVELWISERGQSPGVRDALAAMPTVHDLARGIRF